MQTNEKLTILLISNALHDYIVLKFRSD